MSAIEWTSLPLFEGLSETDVERWVERFEQRDVPAGSGLASEGDYSYRFYVVLDGEVDVHRDFDHVVTLGPGDFFGETGLLQGERRNARVTARTRATVAWMMGWDFREMTAEYPQVADRIRAVAEERAPEDGE